MELPLGVHRLDLDENPDIRGDLTELYRREWDTGLDPPQWNLARSKPGTLRGVHVHPMHDDYVVVLSGRLTIGLYDLRRGSPTVGCSALVALSGDDLGALLIPRGVGHGSVHHESTNLLVGVTHYWGDPLDELGCRWDDPDLGLDWPEQPTLITERDSTAPSLAGLLDVLEPWQPFL